MSTEHVAGIDGCKKGWIAVVLEGTEVVQVEVFKEFEAVVRGLVGVPFIGIDIPIGLSETGSRQADVSAKRFLGARGVSVFEVPPRFVLEAADYETAKTRAAPGKKPSIQLWGLKEKILQVNDHSGLDDRFFEVHPEVSFSKMAEKEPLPSKKTWDGLWRRIELLLLVREGVRFLSS